MRIMESVVGRALSFIETHFGDELTLERVADVAGVGKYHLTRAFGTATGHTVMRYVRARRLTEAARRMAAGDILAVAVEAGYGSHEAFTRAVREDFGVTPGEVRERGGAGDCGRTTAGRRDVGRVGAAAGSAWGVALGGGNGHK